MSNDWIGAFVGIATAVVGLTIVSVLVSSKSSTSSVINSASVAFNTLVKQAVSPVSN